MGRAVAPSRKYAGLGPHQMIRNLLPEEDALDDPDDDDEADPTLPGDLWFRHRLPFALKKTVRGRVSGRVVYSRAFVSLPT
jgi:hypothetical protein